MSPRRPSPAIAVATALFVTLLWSSSWVLIKRGLADLPPLTFAGLRYTGAALILLLIRTRRSSVSRGRLGARSVWLLCLFGCVQFTITQGAQFVALAHLPAQTTSLALSTTPAVVALLSPFFLGERTRPVQLVGIGLLVAGGMLYLVPLPSLAGGAAVGIAAVVIAPIANAAASTLGRAVNRERSPLDVTAVSMVAGGAILLAVGLSIEHVPRMTIQTVATIVWLAVVNTALAFTLWNSALRTLSATQASVINNTMLVQIALLAWIFLGEPLTAGKAAGLALASLGAATAAWQGVGPRSSSSVETPTGTVPRSASVSVPERLNR